MNFGKRLWSIDSPFKVSHMLHVICRKFESPLPSVQWYIHKISFTLSMRKVPKENEKFKKGQVHRNQHAKLLDPCRIRDACWNSAFLKSRNHDQNHMTKKVIRNSKILHFLRVKSESTNSQPKLHHQKICKKWSSAYFRKFTAYHISYFFKRQQTLKLSTYKYI